MMSCFKMQPQIPVAAIHSFLNRFFQQKISLAAQLRRIFLTLQRIIFEAFELKLQFCNKIDLIFLIFLIKIKLLPLKMF